ncbi:MAG: ATP-dependent Clp protease proteolytic subunit [Firmicutes bacterium]|nr:ATP-dependent Clp protease proteolytic subunit [Bacillota bacterium]
MAQQFRSDVTLFLASPEPLTRELATELWCRRRELFGLPTHSSPTVVLVLDSPGGDIHAAYLLARLYRTHASKLTVVVPRFAKSAATLICLAADEIVMTRIAELGPLDPLQCKPGETKFTPVLDEYLALEALTKGT